MIITNQFWLLTILGLVLTGICLLLDHSKIQPRFAKASVLKNMLVFAIVVVIIWLAMINFAATLTLVVFVTDIITLIDFLFFQKKRQRDPAKKMPLIVEYARSFFGVLLLVWVIRSFILQPYRVPTGSLEPTVLAGDFIAVNQFAYGLRFPVINKTLIPTHLPKNGDLILFYFPPDPSFLFVKRVIGIPGDHIQYKNKVLYINGQEMMQETVGQGVDSEPAIADMPAEETSVILKREDLKGVKHYIFQRASGGYDEEFNITVPKGMYFMMGDNRDDSDDSRFWGLVPESHLIGKPFATFLSWDAIKHRIRWNRIGHLVH